MGDVVPMPAAIPGPLLHLTVTGAPDNVRPVAGRARAAVEGLLRTERADDFESAVAEAVANAIEHGSHGRLTAVTLEVEASDGEILARIHDAGGGSLANGPLDLCVGADPEQERGRGLMMMRRLVDEVRVLDDPGGRTVELRTGR